MSIVAFSPAPPGTIPMSGASISPPSPGGASPFAAATPPAVVSASASAPAAQAAQAAPLPPDAAPGAAAERDRQALQKALDEALSRANARTSLRFRVEEDIGEVVVSVVDEDGKTLMQIPDDVALALARRLAETGSGLLDHKA